jgi:hypothetical protein
LSTVNLPAPLNVTFVPLSMKMARSMSTPKWRRTGQSTIRVNAEFLAAANARATPAVSSVAPSQLTQPDMDFWTVGGAFASDPPALPLVVVPPPVVPGPVVPPLAVVPPLVEPPVVVPPAAVVPPDVLPLTAPLPAVPLPVVPLPVVPLPVVLLPTTPLPVVPPRLMVPDTTAVSELPLLDPQAASETLIAARRHHFHALNSIANLITYSS